MQITKSVNKIVKKSTEPLIFILLIIFSILLLVVDGSNAVTEGLTLWFACVVPSLFPYFFITTILSKLSVTEKFSAKLSPITKKLFRVNGCVGYALIMSAIAGYPIGSKTVSDLKQANLLSETEAVRASAFCSMPSPMFLIGSVGGIMFNNHLFGVLLYLINFASAITLGFIFSFYHRKSAPTNASLKTLQKSNNILYEGTYSAVISVLVVGGLITIFYVITHLLESIGLLAPINNFLKAFVRDENVCQGITFGLFECTKGLKSLSVAGIHALPFASFITAFGGLSAIAQSTAYLKKAKIKTAPFILSKILSAVICMIFSCLVLLFGVI